MSASVHFVSNKQMLRLKTHVAYASEVCCKRRSGCCICLVVHICCKRLFSMFHVFSDICCNSVVF
jgi:hypothetical protein